MSLYLARFPFATKTKICNYDSDFLIIRNRRSCPEVFYKKAVLRNFAKFTGKQLCQSLFFNKVAGLEISKNTFSYRTPLVAASEGNCN